MAPSQNTAPPAAPAPKLLDVAGGDATTFAATQNKGPKLAAPSLAAKPLTPPAAQPAPAPAQPAPAAAPAAQTAPVTAPPAAQNTGTATTAGTVVTPQPGANAGTAGTTPPKTPGQQQQQQAAPTAPAPATEQDISALLPQDSKVPPEQRAEFSRGVATWLNEPKNQEMLRGANDSKAGLNTPQAQQFNAAMKQRGKEFVEERTRALAAADPQAGATPQGWAGMFSQASQQWAEMPQEMKMVMGLGLGGGLLAMASSLFGEGGMGMGLLGLLGLGGGLAAGAAGGMFGQDASNMAGDAIYNVGSFFGAAPESADFSMLKGDDPIGAIINGGGKIGTRKEVAAKLQESKQKVEKLQQFMALPVGEQAKIRLMQRLDPSIDSMESAQQVMNNANKFMQAYNDPQSALSQHLNKGEAYANSTGASGWLQEHGAALSDFFKGSADMNINKLIEKWAFNDMDAKELSDLEAAHAKGAPYRVEDARRERELEMRNKAEAPATPPPVCQKKVTIAVMRKAARCWAGYEPVPGAKAYSRGSCRPVGSKKTQKEMKKT